MQYIYPLNPPSLGLDYRLAMRRRRQRDCQYEDRANRAADYQHVRWSIVPSPDAACCHNGVDYDADSSDD